MDLGLRDKVALVTGGSRGIGAGIAAALAAEGCRVASVALNCGRLDAGVAAIRAAGGVASGYSWDLRDDAKIQTFLAAVNREIGTVDIVVANAGTARMGNFLELTEADWAEGFGLKFFGHMRLIRAAWSQLKANRGAVVVIAGAAGRAPSVNSAITGSVNAALLNLTKTLSLQGLADGVRVNAVNPGAIRTDRYTGRLRAAVQALGTDEAEAEKLFATERGHALVGQPADVGDLVCFLASERSRHVQGAMIDIDGGKSRSL